jgi:hypothetical protein
VEGSQIIVIRISPMHTHVPTTTKQIPEAVSLSIAEVYGYNKKQIYWNLDYVLSYQKAACPKTVGFKF